MWDGGKLLIAAIVVTGLFHKVTNLKLLDMAPDAVDDLYNGCRQEAMEKFINSGLLGQELNASARFQQAWSANNHCPKLIPGGTKDHTAALLTYANADVGFIKTFDAAVETMGGNASTYENHFHFKSLHFLLMDSMSLLNLKKCETLYFIHEGYTAQEGSKVRFGSFIKVHSSYTMLMELEDWDGQVIFNITTCFFVHLGADICSEDQDMALISPTEVFTVQKVAKVSDNINDSEYTVIVLNHSARNSTHNCYISSRSRAYVSTQWLVLVLVASSLFFFDC
ncbi:ecto-ADP-ribosyltransferase 5 [Epinephelus moara]|uniref:ecto-ADP-ribosyltransferase 5 n=1 Tax=Epinephelus moara TaxID=300413 RepID=UPI00214E269E|nr:ecto-ADP-ribosyltransferase 5 [Epinephelus moara]XP_049900571.1 ecto-ADP-ribosyltransferase 5 [Epinephelus moara]XP_049900572.1 ecto-ADP-ribosyltransferase 5 [Epinephelus moara]